jgi:diguanylate cyclase (GGDEF)-like protein
VRVLLLLLTVAASAGPCEIPRATSAGGSVVRLEGAALVLPDPDRTLDLAAVQSPAACARFQAAPRRLPGNSGRHWLAFGADLEGAPPAGWLLFFRFPSFDRACVHWPMAGGGTQADCQGLDMRPPAHNRVLFALPAGVDLSRPVYAELESRAPLPLELQLVRNESFLAQDQPRQFLSGLFFGILFLTATYNVLFSLTMRDRASLYYAIHLAALGVALLGFEGYASEFVWPWLGSRASHLPTLLLGVSFVFGNQYGRAFLGTRVIAPGLDRLLLAAAALAACAVPTAFVSIDAAEQVSALSGLAFVLSVATAAGVLARRGYRGAWFLLFGLTPAFLAGVVVVCLRVLDLVSIPSQAGVLLTKVGVVIGSITLSLGLQRRMLKIRRERDRAQEDAAAQHQLALHRAYFDELTQLANRSRFMAAGTELLGSVLNEGRSLLVLAANVRGFREVSRAYGPAADTLLAEIGGRLRRAAGGHALVARMGGDEFAIAVPLRSDSADADARRIAEQVLGAALAPVRVEQQNVRLTLTVGAAIAPRDGLSLSDLVSASDLAIDAARSAGDGPFQFFTPAMRVETRSQLALRSELWDALLSGQIEVHYQPQHDLASRRLVGAEALVRWRHPQHGLLLPADFLHLAEQSDLVMRLDELVLHRACRDLKAWEAAGLTLPRISVNVSAYEAQRADLTERIGDVVRQEGLDAHRLELELTESRILGNLEATSRTIALLRSMGIGVSLDDFGTGYSSLTQIRDLPISGLKVDRSFVADLGESAESDAILTSLVRLSEELHLRLVAEGVETERQRAVLTAHGCHFGQGFLFSPALPFDSVDAYLREAGRAPLPVA